MTEVNDAVFSFCLNLTTFPALCAGQKEAGMSAALVSLIAVGASCAALIFALWWTRGRPDSDDFDQAVGVPEGTSFISALLHCATCPRVVSCHRYIEDRRAKTGRIEGFCPRGDFLLGLTGRQRSRRKAVAD